MTDDELEDTARRLGVPPDELERQLDAGYFADTDFATRYEERRRRPQKGFGGE